jgi:cytochrome c5
MRPLTYRLRLARSAAVAAPVLSVAVLWGATGEVGERAWSITPVSGPSTLHRLGLTIQRTSMGWIGKWGPSPDAPARGSASSDRIVPTSNLTRSFTLTGADLYRLNCRACHKDDGSGAPPEINSLIEPVQGTSLVLWQRRMKQGGRAIDPLFAKQVVSGAKADLLKRLIQGGQKMPSFGHLQGPEVEALVAYLELLAGVPGASGRQRTLVEPAIRLGEHLVKGTCHICHDAIGPWPSPQALLDDEVPSLASLPTHRTLYDVIHKVRQGTPVVMGVAQVQYRGRMPVIDYLTDDEVAAGYLYLITYPPQ